MPEGERITLANKLGLRTVGAGHELSLRNQCLVSMQRPTATLVGGFRQWISQGRAVRKGEHGCMIWVPIGAPKLNGETQEQTAIAEDVHFTIGTVFDISQTEEG